MSRVLAMDESGNTQAICGFCLVSIPPKELSRIGEILSVAETDPPEIKTLYDKVCRGEFKYSAFRQAFRNTGLDVYDQYLRKKLYDLSQLHLQLYYSVFPNAQGEPQRHARLHDEASYLIHMWAHENRQDALDHTLKITVDQQVFSEPMVFEYFQRRGQFRAILIPKAQLEKGLKSGAIRKIQTDRENTLDVEPVNSRSYKRIQLSDMLVGCIREHYAQDVADYYEILKPLLSKQRSRVQIREYAPPAMQRFMCLSSMQRFVV